MENEKSEKLEAAKKYYQKCQEELLDYVLNDMDGVTIEEYGVVGIERVDLMRLRHLTDKCLNADSHLRLINNFELGFADDFFPSEEKKEIEKIDGEKIEDEKIEEK